MYYTFFGWQKGTSWDKVTSTVQKSSLRGLFPNCNIYKDTRNRDAERLSMCISLYIIIQKWIQTAKAIETHIDICISDIPLL